MPSSKQWSDPEDNNYADDDGNILYVDRKGKWRKYKHNDLEYQQQYHYHEEDN